MKNTLEQLIENLIKSELSVLFEGFRGFDLAFFKGLDEPREMVKYAEKYLPLLGKGGTRITFGWKAGKIIKILYSDIDDFDQMKGEVDTYTSPGMSEFLAPIFDYDPEWRWLIAEGVKVFADNADLMAKITPTDQLLNSMAYAAEQGNTFEKSMEKGLAAHNRNWESAQRKSYGHTVARSLEMSDFNNLDMELFRKVFEATGLGLRDISRYDHWGLSSSGKVVLVDYGISKGEGWP